MNNPHARWQRGSSAGSIINWIFYCSYRPFSDSELLPYGKRIWFKYLFSPSNNDRESFSSMCDLTGCPNQAKCLLVGLHLWAGKKAAQPCPTSRWMK